MELAVMDFGEPVFSTHDEVVEIEYCDAIFYLEGGAKIIGEVHYPKKSGGYSPKELEREFMEDFNKSHPYAVHKVVRVKLMRNKRNYSKYEPFAALNHLNDNNGVYSREPFYRG